MKLDLKEHISSLADKGTKYANANAELLEARKKLEFFEQAVRKHGYERLMKQSNAQKFNLEFERLIAEDEENWKYWQDLKRKVYQADANLFTAKLVYDIGIEIMRSVPDAYME